VHDSLPLVQLSRCSIIFDDTTALDEVSFAVRRGERWALVGANGSGKTLLLKMIRGDVWPTPTGKERRTYALVGKPAREPAGSKESIAYIGPERQDKYVRYGWNLTVEQIVTTGLFDEDIPLTKPTRAQRARVERVLKRFALSRLRHRRMLSLSYGQRRLVLVARAFASEAPLLLLDEVFNGLDERTREKLRAALEAPRAGHSWVLTTHRPKELPRTVTHVALIERGKIVYAGRKEEARIGSTPSLAKRQKDIRAAKPLSPSKRRRVEAGATLIRLKDVTLYRDERAVIRNLDWTLNKGEHWAILGPNGSGKSTLLSLLYGDLHPALGGVIERAGAPFGTPIEEWKKRLGWVSPELQADHYAAKSIEEIVISGRYASVGLNEPPTRGDRLAARRWLEFFQLEALRDRGPRQVSYGQMRLALFARAMINDPELLLLDEPCTGLDADVREYVLEVLQRLATSGTQIVMAVHDPEDIVPAVKHVLRIGRNGKTTQHER
jgi:molybdate transport system ATP-binding protein